jgi:uncharacterized protein (DUF2384 family)
LSCIFSSLLGELYDQKRAQAWLEKPHFLLGGQRPLDASFLEVLALIEQIKTGALI